MSKIISGIYAIVNNVNGNRYIGSSENVYKRWGQHVRRLENKNHHSRHLQHAWDKYGADNFHFELLESCDVTSLIEKEQAYLDSERPVYNVSPTAGRTAGVIRSDEYKTKLSKSQSGKVISAETRRKISIGMKGKKNSLGVKRPQSQSTIEKIKNALLGHFVSPETRTKIGSKNKGRKHSEEARRKIGAASVGNKHNLGRVHPEEERKKRAEALRQAWARKKLIVKDSKVE